MSKLTENAEFTDLYRPTDGSTRVAPERFRGPAVRDSLTSMIRGSASWLRWRFARTARRQFFASWPRPRPNARVARRILAIANALDGMSREEAARSAGMDRQTLRDWVLRYNE